MPAAPSAPRRPRSPQAAPAAGVTPARRVAFTVLRRVFEAGAWADRALHAEAQAQSLDARERALATQLAFGAVQRCSTLDHLAEHFAGRPVAELDGPVRAALRLGLFQLAYLDRIPPHAAVGESVELVKAHAPRAAGLVNAVLRRAAREARGRVAALTDDTPATAALAHAHPEWIAQLWWDAFGARTARALLAADNAPAESTLRRNALRADGELPAGARAVTGPPTLPEALVLDGAFDAHGAAGWEAGDFMPQSRAAMAVARILDPQSGERVLDLCAAPGGKTTHLAALMDDRGEVVAVERHAGRAEALRRTAERMGASIVSVEEADAAVPADRGAFDRVLVDPPCSGLGTLRSRPDARWRKSADDPARLAELQGRMLRAGADALAPGATLVYSTCTISPLENEGVVDALLAERGDLEVDDLQADWSVWEHPRVAHYLQTLPSRDGTDGFFIARLRRTVASEAVG